MLPKPKGLPLVALKALGENCLAALKSNLLIPGLFFGPKKLGLTVRPAPAATPPIVTGKQEEVLLVLVT